MPASILIPLVAVVSVLATLLFCVVLDKAQQRWQRGPYVASGLPDVPTDLDVHRAAHAMAIMAAAERVTDLDRQADYSVQAGEAWQTIPAYSQEGTETLFLAAASKLVDHNRLVLQGSDAQRATPDEIDSRVIDLAGMAVEMHVDAPSSLASTPR